MRAVPLVVLISAVLIGTGFNVAKADETLKFRSTMHGVALHSEPIGDVEGHAASVARVAGTATFPDGSVAMTYYIALLDFTNGAGSAVAVYNNVTFSDGSVLWYRNTATATGEATKASIQSAGTLSVAPADMQERRAMLPSRADAMVR